MTEQERAPAGVDATVPSVARMYDYLLGGKDNFRADREAAAQIIQLSPNAKEVAQANRAFLGRAVRAVAEGGIHQFLDIGTGLPTQDNVHQVAARFSPGSRVVYVDNDPIVLVHARALLAETDDVVVVEGDMREPKAILGHPDVTGHLDFRQPLTVIMVAVLHFIPDDDQAQSIVRTVRESLPSGSHLIISHVTAGELGSDVVGEGNDVYRRTTAGNVTPRTREQIAGFFEGLELMEPGLVSTTDWRPEVALDPSLAGPGGADILCAVGRVP
ncbi:SAM-dependent methyltransferase [Nonomuraea fuscirosea]|jgi:SAM-dependent methyltransferase|uniref:SAM-dependent methyltransferase n=1 Tax=Nonomuraea fuscirosea TaxID=1291556 RepID=UPI002DD82E53|nr:SAM-dependent methyltransferase [Nonomuraea fuscirosea]WSA57345.1 SAM-dependent methyltransferase [Nonomuraea fuscirosea]